MLGYVNFWPNVFVRFLTRCTLESHACTPGRRINITKPTLTIASVWIEFERRLAAVLHLDRCTNQTPSSVPIAATALPHASV